MVSLNVLIIPGNSFENGLKINMR